MIRYKSKSNNFLYSHFKTSGHTLRSITIQPIEHLTFDNSCSKSFKSQARYLNELKWIKNLQTAYPLGLNDNIYKVGNISTDPKIDVFSILSITNRKRRSHGFRKNHNFKRKRYSCITIADLNIIFKQSGRHSLLTKLCSLSFSNLYSIHQETDKYVCRTQSFYEVSSIISSFTYHYIKPRIDKSSYHIRHFLKIQFLNKGVDFIDLPSILRDRRVCKLIPSYFNNTEIPIICCKYNKPTRNLLFNYNQVVSDPGVDVEFSSNCNCKDSKFCYDPAGHIVTGDLHFIEDINLRKLVAKGPKYRLPKDIDFEVCRKDIAESLANFSDKWCKRENAEGVSLSAWKKKIFEIIDLRIKFYSTNTHLLPKKSKFKLPLIKRKLKDLHAKFVLVPADKAANNIIFV